MLLRELFTFDFIPFGNRWSIHFILVLEAACGVALLILTSWHGILLYLRLLDGLLVCMKVINALSCSIDITFLIFIPGRLLELTCDNLLIGSRSQLSVGNELPALPIFVAFINLKLHLFSERRHRSDILSSTLIDFVLTSDILYHSWVIQVHFACA